MRLLEDSFEARTLTHLGDEEDFTLDLHDLDQELAPSAKLELRWRFRDAHLLRE